MSQHVPVMLDTLLRVVGPVRGTWIDCTLGAGGYSKALLDAGAERVLGVDCDSAAVQTALANGLSDRDGFFWAVARFGEIDQIPMIVESAPVDGCVFDLGTSSMQLDNPERGFSFMRDGPLDMRMSGTGLSAADIVNGESEPAIAEILRQYGDERKAVRIARAIGEVRRQHPITTTTQLASIVSKCVPAGRNSRVHPATRSFQALRIAVNDELNQLVQGLNATARLLATGGKLAAVSFHSIEDRIVKRFIDGGAHGSASRHQPAGARQRPRFRRLAGGWHGPSAGEVAANVRARSAKLRAAVRTSEPAAAMDAGSLGLPRLIAAA